MERCSLCNGRMLQNEYGYRCMNKSCENANEDKKLGYTCPSCKESLEFKRNTPYGDPIYCCPECKKETVM